jgi:acetoin utilization deacetylase AcuC-like enzyme
MTLLYDSPTFLEHDTGRHPENAARLTPIRRQLHKESSHFGLVRADWQPISAERLSRVHPPEYVDTIRKFAAAGGGQIEVDTVVSPKSFDVALLAAGAVCDAVEQVVRSEQHRQAFCLIRPPGHHALANEVMGFCLLNNVALGARVAIDELGLSRVLVVDWDVHHGNGTQAIFWEDPQVGFFSMHRYPFYPGTGAADETGGGRGLGTTVNLPISYGQPRPDILAGFSATLERLADQIRPELVIISAGFDAHRLDPLTGLSLSAGDFGDLTADLVTMVPKGRCVVFLEGGYDLDALAMSAGSAIAALAGGSYRPEAPTSGGPGRTVVDAVGRLRAAAGMP